MIKPARNATPPDPGALSLFDGGGELGERMRFLDWSRTALGPVERWPQSLKTCVRTRASRCSSGGARS